MYMHVWLLRALQVQNISISPKYRLRAPWALTTGELIRFPLINDPLHLRLNSFLPCSEMFLDRNTSIRRRVVPLHSKHLSFALNAKTIFMEIDQGRSIDESSIFINRLVIQRDGKFSIVHPMNICVAAVVKFSQINNSVVNLYRHWCSKITNKLYDNQ